MFALKDVNNIFNLLDDDDLACTFLENKARTEVMIIDAQKVKWKFEEIINQVFNLKLDYSDLMKFII